MAPWVVHVSGPLTCAADQAHAAEPFAHILFVDELERASFAHHPWVDRMRRVRAGWCVARFFFFGGGGGKGTWKARWQWAVPK